MHVTIFQKITYLLPLCTIKNDVYAIEAMLNMWECPNFTLTIDIQQYQTAIATIGMSAIQTLSDNSKSAVAY